MSTSARDMEAMNVDSETLCSVCESLHVTLDKFIIGGAGHGRTIPHPTGMPKYRVVQGSYDPTGLQTIDLGHLDEIYRKQHCPFCRLVFEATHGDTLPGIGIDGLSQEGQRVKCYMAWQLDARVQDLASATTTESAKLTAKTRRIRIFSPNNAFPDAHILPVDESGAASSYLGRRVSRARIDIDLIRSWLRMCESHHHSQCRIPNQLIHKNGPHGFRLIDVRSWSIVKASLETSRFVALSYLWGTGRHQGSLTLANKARLSQEGAMQTEGYPLPNTIRDAIALTAELGERYLWVDAMCILQDDAEDKEGNITVMDLVYGRAVLTIYAAAGLNSNHGLPGFKLQSREIFQPIETIAGLKLTVLRPVEAYIQQSAWASRGWTFQERQLSKRCLLFTENRVFYQCQEAVWSEETSSEGPSKSWTLDHVGSPAALFNENPLKRYSNSVEQFTGRRLTFEEDILNAFTGIMTSLEQPLGTTFLWALPVAYFDWALLWEPKEKTRRLRNFPSWSWSGWSQQSGWNISTVSGVLGNLHEWIADHTWIVWSKGSAATERELVFLYKIEPTQEHLSERWRGYTITDAMSQNCDVYGRRLSEDPARVREQERSWQLLEGKGTNTHDITVLGATSPDAKYLNFCTYSAHFVLTRDSMSTESFPSKLDPSLNRFGIQDSRGDWCGTIVLDTIWFNHVGGIFEFLAISDAKDFSAEEYDSWSFYIPKEREQSEWDLYYALLVVDHGSYKERAGLAKIYQHAFHSNSFKSSCEWKYITLG
jgi:hypothetical protein